MATAATPPDAGGWCSLSLHAGATVDELRAAVAIPRALLIVEANAQLPRTLGLPPEHPHALHVDEIDVLIESDVAPVALPESPPSEVERAIAEHAARFIRRRRDAADRHRRRARRRRRDPRRARAAATTASTPRCSRRG